MILGVSYDSQEANAKFAKKNDFPFRLLSDPEAEIAKKYGAWDPKHAQYPRRNTYVIGADGKLERVMEKVSPIGHAKELLDGLK